ncbi:hypothetical protein SAMN02745728_01305 [Desulfovibrio litoralis DSM 11393]|uniref:Uncharacterized protein n=2 Tax=Desulfovibrio litoralis TaxID=466107 RepID=A0A1M7SWR0_9BACT|nr:hypothetical protein SAMN02745728_01305 [Desulfovibrio litoralis DSM 11393]
MLLVPITNTFSWTKVNAQMVQADNIHIQAKILSYISEHNGEEFDYAFVSKHFNLSKKQIYKILLNLENEKKIVAKQHRLRKPILLFNNDYENYYWKVYIRSEAHPRSELGN